MYLAGGKGEEQVTTIVTPGAAALAAANATMEIKENEERKLMEKKDQAERRIEKEVELAVRAAELKAFMERMNEARRKKEDDVAARTGKGRKTTVV